MAPYKVMLKGIAPGPFCTCIAHQAMQVHSA
jgi:hypothetical protein